MRIVDILCKSSIPTHRYLQCMAEHFIVSARKYRPDTWQSVVGQKHITTTLQSAISNEQIAQAYLFTGPRGVGKTTCARLFAKAVNEQLGQAMDDLQFNIFELDAASNNSVYDIRTIVDSVRIPPQIGQYKVYIIDEVHMLSAAAFNAFLKTLEEPPAHAIFILATTEKHKIIPTILSRCQIFDFNRIKVRDITEHLANIASQEGVTAETEALHVIAEKADGAMRDALSIFDQVVAFCGRNLTYASVIQNLNVLDYEYYFKLTQSILAEDIPACLVLFNEVLEKGFDGHHFITGLGQHFRNLMVSKDAQTVGLMELSEQVSARYVEQGQLADVRLLVHGLQMINDCDTQYRASKHQRLLVELTLMNLASIPYNQREGEKKKFKLKPFRTREIPAATARTESRIDHSPAPRAEAPVAETVQQTVITTSSVAEPKKPTLGQKQAILKASQSLSLKGMMKQHTEQKQQEIEQAAAVKERPSRVYTLAEIQQAWSDFAEKELTGDLQSQAALRVAEVTLENEESILVKFPSITQEMYFNELRNPLASFMKINFGIQGMDFRTEIMRQDEVKPNFKTAKQQFDELASAHPALETLRKRFNLQVDF